MTGSFGISAAIGQNHKGNRAPLKFGQQFSRARQDFITAQEPVAQQERAVKIEHQPLRARRRG